MEKIIYEAAQLLFKTLSEHSPSLSEVLNDPDHEEIIDECVELVTDELLKVFDEYVSNIEQEDDQT